MSADRDLPSWMAPEWTVAADGLRVAVVRRDFAARFRELGLMAAADAPPDALSPRARPFRPPGGRGAMSRVPAGPLGEAVVRPYRRGGLPGKVVASRYLTGDRAFVELALTLRLRAAGVRTVEPLAAVQSARRPGYRAALVTRFVPDAPPAPEVLAAGGPGRARAATGRGPGPDLPEDAVGAGPGDAGRGGTDGPLRTALGRMGRSARRLHDVGVHHPDLNAYNFLLPRGDAGPAVLLDFDRARALPPPFAPLPRPVAGLALRRLRRSLEKLGLRGALGAWDAFEEGYRRGGSPPRGSG